MIAIHIKDLLLQNTLIAMSRQLICECGTTYDDINSYCKKCNAKHWQDNFNNWTSGSVIIDKLIQQSQLDANKDYKVIEWIDRSNLRNLKRIGSYGKVYSATWESGPITNYQEKTPGCYSSDNYNFFWRASTWTRCLNYPVAIKVFENFDLLLREVK